MQVTVWLALAALAALAGCANVAERSVDGTGGAAVDRQILLTVEQQDFSVLDLTGSPASRYLRRRGYGAAPPAIDRV
ncbi:MAG: hypothetical protein JXB36_14855, partial [Gammaproteobacteria bacterium]|nr:hypothetical protein [Gammaproteobacteria bacterium]